MLVAPENGRKRAKDGVITAQQAKFADAIAAGRPKEAAFLEAGYSGKSIKTAVWRLLRQPAIIQRIAETNAEIAQEVSTYAVRAVSKLPNLRSVILTKGLVCSFLVTCAQEARKDKQYGAAVTAMVQAAKVSGSYVERTEVDVELVKRLEKLGEGKLEDLSDQEAEQFMRAFERLAGWSQKRIEEERRKQGIIDVVPEAQENKDS